MTTELIQIAARVVARAGRDKPADAILRATLREQRGLARAAAGEISRAVFNYFRWFGWLNPNASIDHELAQACELAERYQQTPEGFSSDELVRAVPEWIRSEMGVSPEWLRALQTEPALWLRAKRGQGRALADKLGECWMHDGPTFADAVEYQGQEDLFRTPEFHAGEFEVQDIASQAVGVWCDPKPGETWWDACAGEGGKLLHLSDFMQNKGLIWASDRVEWRLKKLKLRAARAKCFNYRAVPWDGGAKPPTKTKFDGVLVDAPCSGVGTWQRNPHARWTTTPGDVRELAALQARFLSHVAGSVKPGGRLIYSVCTLTRAETIAVVQRIEEALSDFEPLPLPALFPSNAENFATQASARTIWPQDLGGNGMFVAAWRRQ